MSFVALIPATVLWRVERQLRAPRADETDPSDESFVEAIL